MSANPQGAAPGGSSKTSTGPTTIIKRKKNTADPFFSGAKSRAPRLPINGKPGNKLNGAASTRPAGPSHISNLTTLRNAQKQADQGQVSLFSDPAFLASKTPYTDYKIVATKRDLLDGLRCHLMQLVGDKTVDVRSEAEFPKPARLHRRDPFAVIPNGHQKEENFEPRDGMNAAEREELNKRKEIRQKEREANLAQIAPSSQTTNRKVPQFKKKVQQVFRSDLTEEDKKRIQTNYEEKLPWHLEDFDNKHSFVGEHKVGSASTHVAFIPEAGPNGTVARLRMVPVEKLYHFKRKPVFKAMSIDEAEAAMNKKEHRLPAWQEAIVDRKRKEMMDDMMARQSRGLYIGGQTSKVQGRQGEEADMDYDEDFADDEEGVGDFFENKDEDEKMAEKKIKEDLLKANAFAIKLEREYDEEEERERLEEALRKAGSRKIRKALERRERNFNHGSDSDDGSSTDSEEERERLEQERLKNEKKENEDGTKTAAVSGTNTPSGRKEKHGGNFSDREGYGLPKSSSSKSLKRPGSPNLSDASGTDTSITRKKKHKSRHMSSSQQSSSGIARSLSPSTAMRPRMHNRPGSNAGSDTEMGGTGAGGNMSDGGAAMSDGERNRRLQRIKAAGQSAAGSRSASPAPNALGQSISRPNSTAPSFAQAEEARFPTIAEIRTAVNQPGGVTVKQLLNIIKTSPDRHKELVNLVLKVARLDKTRNVLVMKDQ